MRITRSFLLLPLLIVAGCARPGPGKAGTEAMAVKASPTTSDGLAPADPQALAKRIVTQNLHLRERDRVLIVGGWRDAGLLEDLAVQAAVVGADPLIAVGSDRLRRLSFDLVPARFDSVESKLERGLIGITDARIILETNQDPNFLEGVPPARIAAREKANAPLNLLGMQKGIRTVFLGNGMYPTAARAQLYGISQADLAKMFWSGIDLDYTQLQASAAEIQGVLAKGKEVRVTNPNGTDLTASIAGRPVLVSDGVISADDEKRGGPAGNPFGGKTPMNLRRTAVLAGIIVWQYGSLAPRVIIVLSFLLSIASLRRTDLRPVLPQIKIPVMGMFGGRDNIVSPRQWEPLLAGVPHAKIVRWPKAQHFIMLDTPKEFRVNLKSFLDEKETPA